MSTRKIAAQIAKTYMKPTANTPRAERESRLADAIHSALRQREIEVRERLAKIEFAQIVPVDQGYTVSIGTLGLKLCGIESAAISIRDAINQQIAATIRRDSEGQE